MYARGVATDVIIGMAIDKDASFTDVLASALWRNLNPLNHIKIGGKFEKVLRAAKNTKKAYRAHKKIEEVQQKISQKNSKTLWDIKTTADKTVSYKFNGKKMKAYRDPKTGLFWAKDVTGHAESAFKVFKEVKGGKELHWLSDADKYGNYIIGKHKSHVGITVKVN